MISIYKERSIGDFISKMFFYAGAHGAGKRIYLTLSRFTWELPQSVLGWTVVGLSSIIFKRTSKLGSEGFMVHYFEIPAKRGVSAVSLGGTICVYGSKQILEKGNFQYNLVRHHEYGHTRQSRYLGPFYLILIGIPSIISAMTSVHEFMPWEKWADKLGLDSKS